MKGATWKKVSPRRPRLRVFVLAWVLVTLAVSPAAYSQQPAEKGVPFDYGNVDISAYPPGTATGEGNAQNGLLRVEAT
ncbi:MAG: hypothetical protein QHJ73_19240, partial [Armatimonadota bacterium]|nr:hypothetical protein [Armatimonadota bacterium]